MRYAFTVPGAPVPKGRPRLGRGGHTYTPLRTVRHERLVWVYALAAKVRPISGPVTLRLRFYMPDERRRDLDNCTKLVQDALNQQAWVDDSQVAELHVTRHLDRANPRTEIEIEELST